MMKRWGKVLAIIMGIVYAVIALFSILPTMLFGFAFRFGGNFLSIGLNVLHLVLAVAVIVLASLKAKKDTAPVVPPAAPAAGS